MQTDGGMLRVFETGPRTVIGFTTPGDGKPETYAKCRKQLEDLVRDHPCEVLEVDLTGVVSLPSVILAQLAMFRRKGVAVELHHASPDIRYVLQISRLDRELKIVEEPAAEDPPPANSNDGRPPNNGAKKG